MILLAAGCVRLEPAASGSAPDSSTAHAIARDRGERLMMPLEPAGSGRVTLQGVAEARTDLPARPALAGSTVEPAPPTAEWVLPAGEPADVPDLATPNETESRSHDLKPPIPRGAPVVPSGGRGGEVTLDVRVDENGEVTDVERVESDADSATVHAASAAAFTTRYHPALLGARPVAVWTRQTFVVRRGR